MYPNDVKVGNKVYVWNGDGFTKEVEVQIIDIGGIVDSGGIFRGHGEWFYAPVKFDIPQRPVKMVKKQVKGRAYQVDHDTGWRFLEHLKGEGTLPATLIVEVPEEDV